MVADIERYPFSKSLNPPLCKACFKVFLVFKYAYIVYVLFFFTLFGLFLFMNYLTEAYSEPCQTSTIVLFAKIVKFENC